MDPREALEAMLSEPTDGLRAALTDLPGDVVVLGASGKMGPTLVRLLLRASAEAGIRRTVYAVARFTEAGLAERLADLGAKVVVADLLDPDAIRSLPVAPNLIYMVGQKFGTRDDSARTWAVNAGVVGPVAHHYRDARIVVFSTGNVYPLWPSDSGGPTERDPLGPIGDYAQSAVAREAIFRHYAQRYGTPLALLRINYAIEARYGVLRDLAERILRSEPIDLTMGYVNVIWQRDANAIAIQALRLAARPPFVLNVTGPKVPVRLVAGGLGRRLGMEPRFTGQEAATALLADPSEALRQFGPLPVDLEEMMDRVVRWIRQGGASLGKPTHFQERAGSF